MSNGKIMRMPQSRQMAVPRAAPAPQDGDWAWDGTRWVCSPCDDGGGGFPFCPPPGFPPPGCPPWFSGMNSPPWYPGANAGVSFGTTSPPNPVRGHFWWNGLTLFLFDGAVWEPIGGGAGATPPSTTAPANPVPGQQWFNGTTLFVWDGNAWVPVSQTKSTISATAPPAPNPGDTWWNGTQFFIWSGSAWENVGPGATVGPVPTTTRTFAIVQPGFITAPSAWGILTMNATPQVDTQGAWDTVSKKLTPKVAGVYMFEAALWSGGTADGMAIVKNDTGTFSDTQNDNVIAIATATAAGHKKANGLIAMNGTSDFVRLWAQASTAQVWGGSAPPMLDAWIMP
jgi:hypothetical protein